MFPTCALLIPPVYTRGNNKNIKIILAASKKSDSDPDGYSKLNNCNKQTILFYTTNSTQKGVEHTSINCFVNGMQRRVSLKMLVSLQQLCATFSESGVYTQKIDRQN